jgi:hypothetical protein
MYTRTHTLSYPIQKAHAGNAANAIEWAIHFRMDEFLRLQQREIHKRIRTSDLGDFDTWIMRLVRAHSIVVGSQTRPANT